jgi:hypothetical protein
MPTVPIKIQASPVENRGNRDPLKISAVTAVIIITNTMPEMVHAMISFEIE